tara:strand:+ start:68361 stop:69227 length:867 start_codon:yes stop_codon:yes gene_type:complete
MKPLTTLLGTLLVASVAAANPPCPEKPQQDQHSPNILDSDDKILDEMWNQTNKVLEERWEKHQEQTKERWDRHQLQIKERWEKHQNKYYFGNEPEIGLRKDIKPHFTKPYQPSRLEQLANKDLNRKEFKELRSLVSTVSELRRYVTLSKLKYQKTPSKSKNLVYGSPLSTHNNKGNLQKEIQCDELALYLGSFLSDDKDHQVYVVGFGDKRKREDGHSINLIKTPQKTWVYTSNTEISLEYKTRTEALDAGYIASKLSFSLDRLKIKQKLLKPGSWIYNSKASRRLGP